MIEFNYNSPEFEAACDEIKRCYNMGRKFKVIHIRPPGKKKDVGRRKSVENSYILLTGEEFKHFEFDPAKHQHIIFSPK